MRRWISLLALFAAVACCAHASFVSAEPDAHASSAASVVGTAADPCARRYLLYSVQRGEGFSLRRDTFVRMANVVMLAEAHGKPRGDWTLVMPPLSSRLSPHWYNGIRHEGLNFLERTVPYAALWDMEYLAAQTGVRFLEYSDYVRETHADATLRGVQPPLSTSASRAPIGSVDQLLHLCSFSYGADFHQAPLLAGKDGRPPLYKQSGWPRSHLFREFDCLAGERPDKAEGRCSTPLPEVHESSDGTYSTVVLSEYGEVALSRPARQSVHCGLANLMPTITPDIVDEYMSPLVAAEAQHKQGGEFTEPQPLCSALLSNVQLIFWSPPPHQYTPARDPVRLSFEARQLFLRSLRLAPPLLALAHSFIHHALHAAPARALDSPKALAMLDDETALAERMLRVNTSDTSETLLAPGLPPPYLAFHVRRGDFRAVHAAHVPELEHLAAQIVQRFRTQWTERSSAIAAAAAAAAAATPTNAAPNVAETPAAATDVAPLSTRVFVSSDMDATEFAQLNTLLNRFQQEQQEPASSTAAIPRVELVRFDMASLHRRVGALASLQDKLHVSLRRFLAATHEVAARAAAAGGGTEAVPTTGAAASTGMVPLTPFHVLLVDQLLCELSLADSGFVATAHSYVSEMVWQQRKAHGLEPMERQSKMELVGGPLPKQKQTQQEQQQHEHNEL